MRAISDTGRWSEGRSPGSRVEIVLTCQGLRPRRVHVALAVSHPMMLPSVNSTTSAPGNLIYISWLNGWPVNTPVNASPHTSRYATHDSGTLWIAGPSMVGDFHPLISTGLPAHTVFIYSILGIVFIEINLKYPLLSNDSIPTKYGIIESLFFEN